MGSSTKMVLNPEKTLKPPRTNISAASPYWSDLERLGPGGVSARTAPTATETLALTTRSKPFVRRDERKRSASSRHLDSTATTISPDDLPAARCFSIKSP